MSRLKNTGQYFLHEMMHTDLVGQSHIKDERLDTQQDLSAKAYGPRLVHKLAQRELSKGGGAARASTNADSYAMLANCYFPAAGASKNNIEVTADDFQDQGQVFIYFDLGNIADANAVDFAAMLDSAFKGFANDASTPPASPTLPAPGSAPSPKLPAASPMTTENTCDVDYKFFFDRFDIEGKNFNVNKFDTDGSGLKEEISGCGAITDWSFERSTNSEFEWKASGNLPIGTKACVGRAVISAGGSDKDGCTGAG